MTGNTIKSASALGELRWGDAWSVASVILCYALGSTLYRTLIHLHHHHAKPHTSARLAASPLILLAFGISDLVFYTKSFGTEYFGHVLPLALGFGLLNAASTDALGGTTTFAYTGHISKISHGVSDWLFAADPRKRRFRSATRLSARVLGCFIIGIVIGTMLSTAGTHHIVMPSGLSMPAFLVAQQSYNVPLFTLVGTICVILIQLHDHPLPNNLLDTIGAFLLAGSRRQKSKVDVSTLWSW